MSLQAINFDLQITPGSVPPVLHMAQYDSGRQYTAYLKDETNTAFVPGTGATAKIKGFNAAGVAWEQAATVDGSTVVFTPSGAATDQFGVMPVTIEITVGEEVLTPLLVVFDIQKSGYTNEEAVRSPEFAGAMEEAAAEAVGDAVVWRANQAAKTDAMTNPVGIDEDGQLWTTPGGSSDADVVRYTAQTGKTDTEKAQARTNIGAGTYSKPSGGIPWSDLSNELMTSIGKADTAVQPSDLASYVPRSAQATKTETMTQPVGIDGSGKLYIAPAVWAGLLPSGGIPETDLSSAVQTSLGKADTAYQKPSGGIPASDLASDAKPLVVTISQTAGGYSTDTNEADILSAVSAKRVVICKATEGSGYYSSGDDGAEFIVIIGTSSSRKFVRYVIDGTTVTRDELLAYIKPSGGIPSSDLASAVQTSLGKADTALQPSAISDMATKTWVGNQGYLTLATLPVYSGGVS